MIKDTIILRFFTFLDKILIKTKRLSVFLYRRYFDLFLDGENLFFNCSILWLKEIDFSVIYCFLNLLNFY